MLMAELLPDSPSWYNVGSSVTYGIYWGLRVLDVGAAVESAISASALILDRGGRCYGHDPGAYVQRSRERREAIDGLMCRATRSSWVRILTEPQQRRSEGQ
jgi:hypothetical protein